ncbi:MAG TPA: hypothetical protein VK633_13470, partial [Verrucomicrobiae bacterium]|nr:hypothetical protein [Verrucomicrobiae bacterium]
MDRLNHKKIVVIGLDASGKAACAHMKELGAEVSACAAEQEPPSQNQTNSFKSLGIKVISEKELAQ